MPEHKQMSKQQRTILIVGGGAIALYLLYRWYSNRQTTSSSSGVTPDTASTLAGQEASDYSSLAGQEQSDIAAIQNQIQGLAQEIAGLVTGKPGGGASKGGGGGGSSSSRIRKLEQELKKEQQRLLTLRQRDRLIHGYQGQEEMRHQREVEKQLRAKIKKLMAGEQSGRHEANSHKGQHRAGDGHNLSHLTGAPGGGHKPGLSKANPHSNSHQAAHTRRGNAGSHVAARSHAAGKKK